jgi:hypothetical protein
LLLHLWLRLRGVGREDGEAFEIDPLRSPDRGGVRILIASSTPVC